MKRVSEHAALCLSYWLRWRVKVAASTWARYEPPSLSVSTTAQTHLEVRVGFRVLLILPIVLEQATLPRFGHAHILLPALR